MLKDYWKNNIEITNNLDLKNFVQDSKRIDEFPYVCCLDFDQIESDLISNVIASAKDSGIDIDLYEMGGRKEGLLSGWLEVEFKTVGDVDIFRAITSITNLAI